MKKVKKILIGIFSICISFSFMPKEVNASWIKDNNGWWYSQLNYVTGWKQINNVWYYFDSDGYMKTGWILNEGTWYYADSTGAMQTGIVEIDGKTYCLNSSGAMASGKVEIDNKIYNFAMSGEAIGDKIPQATKAFSSNGIEKNVTIINNKNIDVASGKVGSLRLSGNPTTGYSWDYEVSDEGIIKEKSKEYISDAKDFKLEGAGGTFIWNFSGIKEGITKVTFKYSRPWEKEVIETKTYLFIVDGKLNITIKEVN